MFQLQRVFWGHVCSMSKDDILKKLSMVNWQVIQEKEIWTYEIQPNMILKSTQRTIVVISETRKLKLPHRATHNLSPNTSDPDPEV